MRFRVGPWIYRLSICEGALQRDGVRISGTVHERTILIAGDVPARERIEVLLDQLHRLQEHHYGQMTREGQVSFTADIMRQVLAQGGEPALMRLGSEGVGDAGGVEDVGAEPVGCECGLCGTKYAEHQITTGPPELDPCIAKLVVRRWVDCDFCSKSMTWQEGATPAGNPNGRVTSGPEYIPIRSSA